MHAPSAARQGRDDRRFEYRDRGVRRTTARLGAAVLGFFAVACTASPEPAPPAASRVAVIGWDGASWAVIEPLLARGELPALEALLGRGSRGVLVADPPTFSPAVWTTLATGFRPDEHGVTGFLLPDPAGGNPILASSFHRRRAPLWRIASASRRPVGVVGWWTTWPAEPVHGYLVSDHLAYNRWSDWAPRPDDDRLRLAYPDDLAAELAAFAVGPGAVPEEDILALAPFDDRERREMLEATAPIKYHAPSVLRFGYATDAANQAFALHLLDTRPQPDLFSLTYILTDVAGHVFWHHYEPEAFPEAGPGTHLRDAIPNVYRRIDRWTGDVLERLDPDTIVVVVSDHGMRASGRLPRPDGNPSGDHDLDGILVVSGPDVVRGADLGRVPAIDFAPSILALLGLPVGEDMPGRPRTGWAGTALDVASVPTHGDGRDVAEAAEPSPADEAFRERLRSLGYID